MGRMNVTFSNLLLLPVGFLLSPACVLPDEKDAVVLVLVLLYVV